MNTIVRMKLLAFALFAVLLGSNSYADNIFAAEFTDASHVLCGNVFLNAAHGARQAALNKCFEAGKTTCRLTKESDGPNFRNDNCTRGKRLWVHCQITCWANAEAND